LTLELVIFSSIQPIIGHAASNSSLIYTKEESIISFIDTEMIKDLSKFADLVRCLPIGAEDLGSDQEAEQAHCIVKLHHSNSKTSALSKQDIEEADTVN